jgi:hypothetical protein
MKFKAQDAERYSFIIRKLAIRHKINNKCASSDDQISAVRIRILQTHFITPIKKAANWPPIHSNLNHYAG